MIFQHSPRRVETPAALTAHHLVGDVVTDVETTSLSVRISRTLLRDILGPVDLPISRRPGNRQRLHVVRVFDRTDWSACDSFTLTSQNTPPAAAIDNQSVDIDEWVPLQTLITASDADNDAITQYQFYDAGAAAGSGYFWTADLGQQPADTNITVNAADLGTTWVRGGQVASTDLMWVRAFDGTDWSAWDPFTLTTMA